MAPFEFRSVPRLVCQSGATDQLTQCLAPNLEQARLGPQAKVFFLVDPFIESTDRFSRVLSKLKDAGMDVKICTDVEPDPPEADVIRVTEQAMAFGAEVVIGLGGGSTLDIAKLVAILCKGEQTLGTMYGVGNVTSGRLPLVLIPTTSGTGSEVTPISIVTTGADTKMGVVSPVLYADLAILDADWTVSLPQHVTAATGIDAMVHAIEAYTSVRLKNPYSDFLACQALKLLSANLLKVCETPDDREARQAMMLGACIAGQAFANAPVGGVHALAYPIGGIFHVSHGLSNSLVLPEVLKFNLPKAEHWYAELANVVNCASLGQNAHDQAEAFIEWASKLSPSTGLPSKLSGVGIKETDLDRMAESAMLQTRLLSNNPREIDQAAARAIYAASL
ncbi:MAG: iron-containing alcohol dehydrogenase [Limnobacter sp.]|nr:iron-containing alcohol dehydrogenase [Limnobacter sp.]